jgi:hypothetical protein
MAVQTPGINIGICTAAADLSAASNQFRAVRVTAAFAVNLTNAAGQATIGILQNKPASGQPADIVMVGVSKAVAGAAITVGSEVMAGADGRIITAATAGSNVIGVALEAAANANEVITVALNAGAAIV